MPTSKEYRQHAQACLSLARTALDLYAQEALLELASDFNRLAQKAEHGRCTPKFLSSGGEHSESHARNTVVVAEMEL
jgi:hypothetical protein